MMYIVIFVSCLVLVSGGPAAENLKDQFCTDPRTMRKHAAYTEWADAYSCTRHRCQPGGRNLAIYTVGCKRVEAPESAIECEEVVEDTNMQFPYCCTRLRCLVVVRGEVWTRVLGQPWETLPAAPWSHMYKMKKPPPVDSSFLPKETDATGPVYELSDPEGHEKVLRASKKDAKDCAEPVQRSAATPDIVIALSTGAESKKVPEILSLRHRSSRKENMRADDDVADQRNEIEAEEAPVITEKVPEVASEERFFSSFPPTKPPKSYRSQFISPWTDAPQEQSWPLEREKAPETESLKADAAAPSDRGEQPDEKKSKNPTNLQALVDAIGTRMRDIETVVQKMNSRVIQAVPKGEGSGERRETEHRKDIPLDPETLGKPKKSNPDSEQYKRFVSRSHSKYLHTSVDGTTETPLFVEDTHLNGYYSDASNNLLRRNGPKEPAATYMAPVNTDTRRSHSTPESDEGAKHKKHTHKRKKSRRSHKKHQKEEKKHFNKVNSIELDRNVVSLEDSGVTSK